MHLSRRLKWWSCVVRRPSVVNFSLFWLLLWNRWTEFKETWQEARSQRPLPSLCFSGRSEKQDGHPGLWLAETFSTSSLKPLNGIQRNLTGSKISTSSTKFVFFWVDRKNKMAALASDWLRHFQLLLWNRWMKFNETWQEARSQRPLPSLCFSGRSEKQDGCPGLWLAETFSTSPLKLLNGIQRNLTGSRISTSSTKFVLFGPISKQKYSPWLIPQKGGRLYSGARYVALLASCFLFSLFISGRMHINNLLYAPRILMKFFNVFIYLFTKLDRDEVLIVTHLCIGFLANSTQGRIQGRAICQK